MSNSDTIKVSVIMPIYNAYDYLRPAMDSVLDQTVKDIEIICVDDGSTDHSLDILKEYQKSDSRIRIITENNAGPSIARNKGLARARGEYVIFLDADDFYEPTLLEKMLEIAERDNLDIAVCKYDIYNDRTSKFEAKIKSEHDEIFEPLKIVSKNEFPDQIFQCFTGYVWNKLWKRSFLKDQGLNFNEELRVFEDAYFVVTAFAMADRTGKVFDVLIHHRVYSAQSKNKLFRKYYKQVPLLYFKIKEFLMQRGLYAPLYRSFLNLSASRCYKIYNVLWRDAKQTFYNMLHENYAEELGWHSATSEDIEEDEVRDFVASVILYNHSQYEKKSVKGIRVRIEKVRQKLKNMKFRRSFISFFTSLFRKKKKK